jgi:GT2 family glycosyltransferase
MTMTEITPKVSISLVHHHGLETLRDCLISLYANPPGVPFEIVMVDNMSTDGAVDMLRAEFPDVRLFVNTARCGFGVNQNTGIGHARGEYLFLLNDDTIVHPGAIDTLIAFLDSHPQTAVVGPRLLNPDGSLQRSCYRFPTPFRCVCENLLLTAALPNHPVIGDYRAWPHDTVRDVDFVIGAAMLVRRKAIEEVGLFDPSFFMYVEETDWERRMRQKGWSISFSPDSEITHLGGQSSEGMRDHQFCENNRSNLIYFRKHFGVTGVVVQYLATLAGVAIRLPLFGLIALLVPNKRAKVQPLVALWWRILKWYLGFGPRDGIRERSARVL